MVPYPDRSREEDERQNEKTFPGVGLWLLSFAQSRP